jgi:hypothetical protein
MSTQQISPDSHHLNQQDRGWYSVSVASVRLLVTMVSLIVGIIVAFFAYNHWLSITLEDRAAAAVETALELTQEIEKRDDFPQIYAEHKAAWDQLESAKTAMGEADFETGLELGQSCVVAFRTILGQSQGSIRVMSVQGNVEQRRGQRGAWKRLRQHDTLNPGDWVKTATDGTAKLVFSDRSIFTLRQSTMVHLGDSLGPGSKGTNLEFGKVLLNTSDAASMVSTPKSTAEVRSDSKAEVSFDRTKNSGRFASFEGSLAVANKADGKSVVVAALQQIEQFGDQFSQVKNLPAAPTLLGPGDDQAFDLDSDKEVRLSWKPVGGAQKYSLQIATTRLFANKLIDDTRSKSSARLGIQGEGNFYWQVSAIDSQGAAGPWSEPRAFRISSVSSFGGGDDHTPPYLLIIETEAMGNLVIVTGKTEAGAIVTINGEGVVLKPDGAFRTTIQMTQTGWSTLEVVAVDAWKNEAKQRTRVFIEAI